jgi:LysM repeat protein
VISDSISLSNSDTMHIVKQGDTLFSISKKYNITVDAIKVKNNLSDNAISIGQTLIIR